MSEKDTELLNEFEDLIHTIAKEVSVEISSKIATEAIEKTIESVVMQELKKLIDNANVLNHSMPEIENKMQHTFDNIKESSEQIDKHLSSISSINRDSQEYLIKAQSVSNDLQIIINNFLNKMEGDYKNNYQEIINKFDSIDKEIKDIESHLEKQEKSINAIEYSLRNRGAE